jgi:hypothetical protein
MGTPSRARQTGSRLASCSEPTHDRRSEAGKMGNIGREIRIQAGSKERSGFLLKFKTTHVQMEQSFEYDVFLSYSGEDKELAGDIYQDLTSHGLHVFFSNETLKTGAGEEYLFQLQAGLERSQHFLLVATSSSMQSKWVRIEWSAFFLLHVTDAKGRLFFIILGPGFDQGRLPLFLRSLQVPESVEEIAHTVMKINPSLGKKSIADLKDLGRFEQNLLELFGNHRVEAVDDHLLRQYLGPHGEGVMLDPRLSQKYATIQHLKLQIEALESPDARSMMGKIITQLDRLKYSRDPLTAKLFYDLVRKTYYPKWSKSEIDRFERAAQAVLNWQDVYLSYTNRDAVTVNTMNRRAIRREMSAEPVRRVWTTQNLVARIIEKFLRQQNLQVFDEYHDLVDKMDIDILMKAQLENSFFLVQLLEPASFSVDSGMRNWMFDEYTNFMRCVHYTWKELPENRYLPIILGESPRMISPAAFRDEHKSWLDHVQSIDPVVVFKSDALEWRRQIIGVAQRIVAMKHNMLESMLDL